METKTLVARECARCGQPFIFDSDTTLEYRNSEIEKHHTKEDCDARLERQRE